MKINLLFSLFLALCLTVVVVKPVFAVNGLPLDGAGSDNVTPLQQGAPSPMGGTSTAGRPPAGSIIARDDGYSASLHPDDPSYNNYPDGQFTWCGTAYSGTEIAYLFIKFVVPPHPGITADCLKLGVYNNYQYYDNSVGKTGAYYFRNNDWSRSILTWNSRWNQSFNLSRGPLLDSIHIPLSPSEYEENYYEWNVTSACPGIWEKGGTITIVLAQANPETGDYWRDFESLYYAGGHPPYLRACDTHQVTTWSLVGTVYGQGSSVGVGTSSGSSASSLPVSSPVQLSNILVQSAAISSPEVATGEKVDVTADIINRGSASGETSVILYVNGQAAESRGVSLAAGQSSAVHFYVSMNEPGTYTVHVGNVPAGRFTVDALANNGFWVYGLIVLFFIGIAVTLFFILRRRTA